MSRPARVALSLWIVFLLACVGVVSQTRFVADMSAFMPKMPTARQQLLLDQFRDGIIGRLLMVGLEGGSAEQRARWSQELAGALRQDAAFLGVQNGDAQTGKQDRAYFFGHRYALSPAVSPERFSAEGLHAAIGQTLAGLSGSGGMLIKTLLAHDPTGETLALLDQFAGASQPSSAEGVWASRDGQRALLLVQTREQGSNVDAQAEAIARIRGAFARVAQGTPDARLVMSGTGVFSVASRERIGSEVSRLALASTAAVLALLWWIYRSPRLMGLGVLPVISGALAGVAAVSLVMGQVHGLTLAFGTTLIGEAVDYSIYLFVQGPKGDQGRRLWRTIGLGVLTSIAGFAALLFSGFPGLSQLGLYSITGLVTAALVTRYVLPHLISRSAELAPLAGFSAGLARAVAGAWRLRWLALAAAAVSCIYLLWHSDGIWSRQLSALNPVAKAELELDASLRADLGAPDLRYVVALTAPDVQAALQRAEQVGAVLQRLVDGGQLGGFASPTSVWPSLATQQRRLAALPDAPQMQARLGQALQGLPLRAEKLQGFLDDVQAARAQGPITRADLQGSSAAMLVDSTVVQRAGDVLVMLPLRAAAGAVDGAIDVGAVDAALRAANGSNDVSAEGPAGAPAVVIDVLDETSGIFEHYLQEARVMALAGGVAVIILLGLALRSVKRVLFVLAPLLGAVVCVAAAQVASGQQLSILHLVGLLLVVALGSNYALFFDVNPKRGDAALPAGTLVSLAVANLTTVLTFGLLAISSVPVLSAVGSTVAPGALLALAFAAIGWSARRRSGAAEQGAGAV